MAAERHLKPVLDAEIAALPGGIGNAVRYVKAAPILAEMARDLLHYQDVLPEEITEPLKVALDILDGGDGVIYR